MTAARLLRSAALAAAVAAVAAACGSGRQCVLVGYERAGTPPEAIHADLRAAMTDAERRVPSAAEGDAAAAQAVLLARVDAVDATMRSRGYRRVERLVDCDRTAVPAR